MGPFDFLSSIKRGLEQFFQPSTRETSSALSQYFPSRTMNYRLDKSAKAPDITPVVKKAEKPTPTAQDFNAGFAKFGSNVPVATASPTFVEASKKLPPGIDPFLPAIISLMETGGGSKQVANNNPFNISGYQNGNRQFINYPNLDVALMGGDNGGVKSQGFVGNLMNNPAYTDFIKSGNLADFFNVYTPPGEAHGNPSLEELLNRYGALRQLFPTL